MFDAETISKSIAQVVARELQLDQDRKEVIAYGMYALVQIMFSIVLVIILGLLFDRLLEALIVSFATAILRKFSGGIHTSSASTCAYLGALLAIVIALIMGSLKIGNIGAVSLIIMGFIWSYYIIYKLAPVDSPAKPIYKEEKRKKLKRGSILVLNGYVVFVIGNLTLYYTFKQQCFQIYALCLVGGMVWQAYTLTPSAHLILDKIDK